MRGFLAGSLALIVLYTVIDSSQNAGAALQGSAALFARFLSPQVAAVPDFAARKAAAAAAATKTTQKSSATVNPTVSPYLAGLAPPRQPTNQGT